VTVDLCLAIVNSRATVRTILATTDLKFDHHACLSKSRVEQSRGGKSSNSVRNGCCSLSSASRGELLAA
jgi:hypothetical protein